MSDIKFSKENMTDLISELAPLWDRHWAEIAHFKDVPLEPRLEAYKQMELNDMLRTFIVRDSGKIIGYCIFIVMAHLHYKSHLQAVEDVIYIEPSYRGTGLGRRFIEWCDEILKSEGVTFVSHHVKAKHNFGPLLEKIGYEVMDIMFVRKLK